jgi:hypothetical protein
MANGWAMVSLRNGLAELFRRKPKIVNTQVIFDRKYRRNEL